MHTAMQDGTVETRDGQYVLRYERHLDHPVDKVWAALTEPGELVGWLAEAEVELVEGGRVVLRWQNTDDQGNTAVMHATITRLEPPRLLEYEGDIHGTLRWELSEEGDSCLLRLTVITEGVPEEARSLVMAGWHIHLEHLEDALEGRPVDWARWDEEHRPTWQAHHDRYSAALDAD
jgi:uncharacterized protein YndB with AHSA1/START domain